MGLNTINNAKRNITGENKLWSSLVNSKIPLEVYKNVFKAKEMKINMYQLFYILHVYIINIKTEKRSCSILFI